MEYLPDPEEQDWLLGQLAELIQLGGYQRFVCTPLVEPDARFFPDRITMDAPGLERLLRRLLHLVGVEKIEVHVADPLGAVGQSACLIDQSIWFDRVDDNGFHFFFENSAIDRPQTLGGRLCHAVTHARRAQKRLRNSDPEVEEELVDLTTIYLNLGIISTNYADQYRRQGYAVGHSVVTEWSTARGVLAPHVMSFLLAAQAVASGRNQRSQSNRRRPLAGDRRTGQWVL